MCQGKGSCEPWRSLKCRAPQHNSCSYLGIYFMNERALKCVFYNATSRFFRTFNAVYGKVGRAACEECLLALLKAKCLTILLYGTKACPLLSRDRQSFEFTVKRLFVKIFWTGSPLCLINMNLTSFVALVNWHAYCVVTYELICRTVCSLCTMFLCFVWFFVRLLFMFLYYCYQLSDE